MQHFEDLKNKAQRWKDQLTKTPLEILLSEATSNENWNTNTKVSQDIADASYSYEDCNTIVMYIQKRLNDEDKDWKRILKTLILIEYLIKNGAIRCINELKDDIYKIRALENFKLIDQGHDRGQSIREKIQLIQDLLTDDRLIQIERDKAKNIREKLKNCSAGFAISNDPLHHEYCTTSGFGVNPFDSRCDVKNSSQGLQIYKVPKAPNTQRKISLPLPSQKETDTKDNKIPPKDLTKQSAKSIQIWSIPFEAGDGKSNWEFPAAVKDSLVPAQGIQMSSLTSLLDMDDMAQPIISLTNQIPQPSTSKDELSKEYSNSLSDCQLQILSLGADFSSQNVSYQLKQQSLIIYTQKELEIQQAHINQKEKTLQQQQSQAQQIQWQTLQDKPLQQLYQQPFQDSSSEQKQQQIQQNNCSGISLPQYQLSMNPPPQLNYQMNNCATILQTIQAQYQPDVQSFQNYELEENQFQNIQKVQSREDKLFDLTDLTKNVERVNKNPNSSQLPVQPQNNQLYSTQYEMDSIQLNYRIQAPQVQVITLQQHQQSMNQIQSKHSINQ